MIKTEICYTWVLLLTQMIIYPIFTEYFMINKTKNTKIRQSLMVLFSLSMVAGSGLGLTACKHKGDKRTAPEVSSGPFSSRQKRTKLDELNADELYSKARNTLSIGEYAQAQELYATIQSRYPFSRHATQAQLESIYGRYRAFQLDEAEAAAERFIKEHPRHPSIDYVYYLKGLVYFEQLDGEFDKLMRIDSSKQDTGVTRRAFETFGQLCKLYPNSVYVNDSRQRMIHLRNRLARSELHVAQYYFDHGAWAAASRRSQYILERFQGTEATIPALDIMIASYRELGLNDLAAEIAQLRATNTPNKK